MSTTTDTAVSYEVEAEITIDATPDVVWRSLTEDIGRWWPHSFADEPAGIELEPWIGGRFFERFDDAGAGALYAVVTYIQPNTILRISGPMGMAGARQYVKTYRLEAVDGGTVVRTTASMLGNITDEIRDGYRSGGEELLEALKRYVERDR